MNESLVFFTFVCMLNANKLYCIGVLCGTEIAQTKTYANKSGENFYKYGEDLDKPLQTFTFLENPQFVLDIKSIEEYGKSHKKHRNWLELLSKMAEWNMKQARQLSIQYSHVTVGTMKIVETMKFRDINKSEDPMDSGNSQEYYEALKINLFEPLTKYNNTAKRLHNNLTDIIYLSLFKHFTGDSEFFKGLPNLLEKQVTDERIKKIQKLVKLTDKKVKKIEHDIDKYVNKLKQLIKSESITKQLNSKMKKYANELAVEIILGYLNDWNNMLSLDSVWQTVNILNATFNEISQEQQFLMSEIKRFIENPQLLIQTNTASMTWSSK